MYARTGTPTSSLDPAVLAVCRGLEPRAAVRVAGIGSFRNVAAGTIVFNEGDRADGVYEVMHGMLKLYRMLADGRRQVIGFIMAGELVGLTHQDHFLSSAMAITDIVLCRYSRSQFDRLVSETPSLARHLLDVTFEELRAAADQMLLLGRKTASEKIASFLLQMGRRQAQGDEPGFVDLPMARNDIGDYLGLTSETVSRSLTKLKKDGIIVLETPVRVRLSDLDALEDLAAGNSDEDDEA